MKWITPLWRDPIGWSDWIAKTKLRVIIWTLIHIAFIFWGFYTIKKDGLMSGAPLIIFIGVAYPCMYMCAMYQLLKMAKETQKKQNKAIVETANPLRSLKKKRKNKG